MSKNATHIKRKQPLTTRLLLFSAVMTLWVTFTASAYANPDLANENPAEKRQQLYSSLVRLSGLTGLSQQARNLAQQALNQQQAALGHQYQVAGRVAQLWGPVVLEHQLEQALERLSDQQLNNLQQLLTSPSLQSARHKESNAITDQGTQVFLTYVQKLRNTPPAAARLQLIEQLDKAMRFSEFMRLTRASVYTQLQAVLPDWQPAPNWQQTLNTEIRDFLLYTYRNTPNRELQELITLHRNKALQQWLAAVKNTLPQQDS